MKLLCHLRYTSSPALCVACSWHFNHGAGGAGFTFGAVDLPKALAALREIGDFIKEPDAGSFAATAGRGSAGRTLSERLSSPPQHSIQWGQNISIVEAGPFRPGQTVTYLVSVWLINCEGAAAVGSVLTLSLLAHTRLVTRQPECATLEHESFVECVLPTPFTCDDGVYSLRTQAQLPAEGSFGPFIASVSSDSVSDGFRTFAGGFTPLDSVSSELVTTDGDATWTSGSNIHRTGPYFRCGSVAGQTTSISGSFSIRAGQPCKDCCFATSCWLDRGQLVVQNYQLSVGSSGADDVTLEGISGNSCAIDRTWPPNQLPAECTLSGSRIVCHKDRIWPPCVPDQNGTTCALCRDDGDCPPVPACPPTSSVKCIANQCRCMAGQDTVINASAWLLPQRNFYNGLTLPQPLQCNVSTADVASKFAIVPVFWAARTLAGDVSWQICRTFVNDPSIP
eukprot:COSAG01_NODE_639_length_14598_cov_316.689841_10_plen_451_part_00